MSKKNEKTKETASPEVNTLVRSKFVTQISELMYYSMEGNKVPFESLDQKSKDHWYILAGSAMIAIDKMGQCVVKKVEPAQAESDHNTAVLRMTGIIQKFVRNVQTIRCQKCGSKADIRPMIFPCEELAHKVLEGANGNG